VSVVFPSHTPERISTWWSSRRSVTCLEVLGYDKNLIRLRHTNAPSAAGLPAVAVGLDIGFAERHSGWTAIHHTADRGAVRFAEGVDGEEGAERVAGHGCEFTAS